MGSASSSAASGSSNQSSGGNITINKPNWIPWAVGGVVAVVLGFLFLRRKKR